MTEWIVYPRAAEMARLVARNLAEVKAELMACLIACSSAVVMTNKNVEYRVGLRGVKMDGS